MMLLLPLMCKRLVGASSIGCSCVRWSRRWAGATASPTPWSEPSLQVARRLDFVARAGEVAQRGQPAVLLVVGAEDDADGVREPAEGLREALASRYDDPQRAELVVVPGMAHALADEPGVEPAPQTEAAVQVDAQAVRWLRRHLLAGGLTGS